jgi:hypothetical protein
VSENVVLNNNKMIDSALKVNKCIKITYSPTLRYYKVEYFRMSIEL